MSQTYLCVQVMPSGIPGTHRRGRGGGQAVGRGVGGGQHEPSSCSAALHF